MPDSAYQSILDRNLYRIQIEDSFAPQIEILEQMVNYGSNLIPRCFDSSDKKIPEVVCILAFLKHAVSAMDAIRILVEEGATVACFSHIRSLFEIKLYLSWIFKEDYERRGKAYYVWNIRNKRFWNRCHLVGTPEQTAHLKHMAGGPMEGLAAHHTQAELAAAVAQGDKRLQHAALKEINELFDGKVSKSGKDVEWHAAFGMPNLRAMARDLNMESWYKVFYTNLSEITYGKTLNRQVSMDSKKGKVFFDPIRTLDSVPLVFQFTLPFAFELFELTLARYRPDEVPALMRKYKNEWREAWWTVPTVEKTKTGFTIRPTDFSENLQPPEN